MRGGAFESCGGFTGDLIIPNSVLTIGGGAFADCNGFTGTLTISESLTTISESVFISCSGFTGNLNIPESVTTIGQSAFAGCSGFTGTLNIPESVTEIANWAFGDCNFSSIISLNPTPPKAIIEQYTAFEKSYCEKTPLIVPDGSEDAYASSPVWEWFQSITGLEAAGIEDVEAEGDSTVRVKDGSIIAPEGSEIFDLNGRKVAASGLRPGIYIVRIPGTKAVKVMVK